MFYRNSFKPIVPIVFVMLVSYGHVANAFSLPEWLGFGDEKEESKSVNGAVSGKDSSGKGSTNWAESSAEQVAVSAQNSLPKGGSDKLQFDEVKFIVSNLNAEQREKLLSDETAFDNFVQQQGVNRAVLVAARTSRLEEDPLVQLLIRKSSENTLREIYIKRLIDKELLSDAPSEEQAKLFYNDNLDKFTLEERIHLWQIFLPFGENPDSKTKESIKRQTAELRKRINGNEIDFAAAATQYSKHIPSRYAGGYMGLVKISEVKPELKELVLSLKDGELSEPILAADNDGYHLIKRSNKVVAETLPYERVKDRVYQMIRKGKEDRLRRAIIEQASKAHDQGLDSMRIEQWRLKLRTDLYKGADLDM